MQIFPLSLQDAIFGERGTPAFFARAGSEGSQRLWLSFRQHLLNAFLTLTVRSNRECRNHVNCSSACSQATWRPSKFSSLSHDPKDPRSSRGHKIHLGCWEKCRVRTKFLWLMLSIDNRLTSKDRTVLCTLITEIPCNRRESVMLTYTLIDNQYAPCF